MVPHVLQGRSRLGIHDLVIAAGNLLVQSEVAPGRPGPLTDASHKPGKLLSLSLGNYSSFLEPTGQLQQPACLPEEVFTFWGHERDMAWELWTTERDREVLVENGEPGLWGS